MAELARRSGVSERSLGDFERGNRPAEPSTLVDIARALEFPVEFLTAPDIDQVAAASASFRSLSRMSAHHRNAALASASLAVEFARWLDRRYELPAPELEDFAGTNPEVCAELVRRTLGLGDRPVRNVVHLLESRGVRVFSLAEDCRELDAISFWRDDLPVVLLNTQKSAERARFDAAHEFGHLLLHRHGHGACADPDAEQEQDANAAAESKPGRATENEANAFASAFLMPKAGLLAGVSRWPTIDELIEVKRAWRVSLVALVYRLHSLGWLSDGHYRSLCIDIQRRGYRTEEPNPIGEREGSQILVNVFDDLREAGQGRAEVAHSLRWPRRELEAMVFGLAVSLVPGGRESPASPTTAASPAPSRSHLHLLP